MKTIITNNAIISIAESKAVCPHCTRQIPMEELDEKWANQEKAYMRIKCKCKRFIGISRDLRGDFVSFDI